MTRTPPEYELRERRPNVEEFRALREATDMRARSREGVERGLPNTLFGAVVVHEPTDATVGMGRIVGDGGTLFVVSDVAVHPDHQGRGLGSGIMESLVAFLERNAPPEAYVNLMATSPEFYEQFGFEEGRPTVTGMYTHTE